jgi:hypothetical protein
MSDRLDRIEKIVESNAKAIEALANESVERDRRLNQTLDRLANIVLSIANRQDDHENRINRLEQS